MNVVTREEKKFLINIDEFRDKSHYLDMLMIQDSHNGIDGYIIRSLYFDTVYDDDLGSGYTSLANLCDYPIDVVKIDRDILLKTESEKGKDLFSGIVALAHSLNIKVICEGVETQEQNTLVSSSACDFVQGWFYSKALPLEECETFIDLYEKKQGIK